MNKNYKKFYEIGSNRYYVLSADGDVFLATETYIPIKGKFRFSRSKDLTQGLKLLELSAPMSILFQEIANLKPRKQQSKLHEEMKKDKSISEEDIDDMTRFESLSEASVKKLITKNYEDALKEAKKELKEWYNEVKNNNGLSKEGLIALRNRYEDNMKILDKQNPLHQDISIDDIKDTAPQFIKDLIRVNKFKHLYTRTITNFVKDVFLYDLDVFGQVTIYRITLVKNEVKSIDSFIYDRKLIKELLKYMYENNI